MNKNPPEFKVYEKVVKKHLIEIIHNAFYFDRDIESYINFKLIMIENEDRDRICAYFPKSKTVRCYKYSIESCDNIASILHEVAKHICIEMFGEMSTNNFYGIYKKLLHSLFDLNKMAHSQMYELDSSLQSYSETISIVKQYLRRRPRISVRGSTVLEIYNSYEQKELLKEYGFVWDTFRKCWHIEIEKYEDAMNLTNELLEKGVQDEDIVSLSANSFVFTRV